MTRVTVRDSEKILSFHGDERLVRVLVAACAAEPRLFEDLLVATEPYCRGFATRMVQALIQHDLALARQRTTPLFDVFEVHSEPTRRLAYRADGDGLVVFDLAERTIQGWVPAEQPITARGTVTVERVASDLERETVYVLGAGWRVAIQTELQPQRERAYA